MSEQITDYNSSSVEYCKILNKEFVLALISPRIIERARFKKKIINFSSKLFSLDQELFTQYDDFEKGSEYIEMDSQNALFIHTSGRRGMVSIIPKVEGETKQRVGIFMDRDIQTNTFLNPTITIQNFDYNFNHTSALNESSIYYRNLACLVYMNANLDKL